MEFHEAHVELLLGKKVIGVDGRVVGRIEEMKSAIVDGERVVTAFHIGPAALFERVGGAMSQLPLFRMFGAAREARSVPWDKLDLSDPRCPRLRAPLGEIGKTISRSDIPSHPS